jgi:chromosome condensin MukBEF ATPase and DNA-binding subunit MukB
VGATVVQSPHVEAGAGTYEVAIVTGAALHSTQAVLATGAGATGAGLDQSFHTELETGAGAGTVEVVQSCHWVVVVGLTGAGVVVVVQSCH